MEIAPMHTPEEPKNNVVPFLDFLTAKTAHDQQRARDYHENHERFRTQLIDLVNEAMRDGLHIPDFADALLGAATYVNVLRLDEPSKFTVFEARVRSVIAQAYREITELQAEANQVEG
jgi:hypothetical protein